MHDFPVRKPDCSLIMCCSINGVTLFSIIRICGIRGILVYISLESLGLSLSSVWRYSSIVSKALDHILCEAFAEHCELGVLVSIGAPLVRRICLLSCCT